MTRWRLPGALSPVAAIPFGFISSFFSALYLQKGGWAVVLQVSTAGTAALAAGVVEQTLYHFLGIAVAVLFEAQGPGVVGVGQVAQFQQDLCPGWIVPQNAKGLAARAGTGTQGR